jgi:hypothetical protein
VNMCRTEFCRRQSGRRLLVARIFSDEVDISLARALHILRHWLTADASNLSSNISDRTSNLSQ